MAAGNSSQESVLPLWPVLILAACSQNLPWVSRAPLIHLGISVKQIGVQINGGCPEMARATHSLSASPWTGRASRLRWRGGGGRWAPCAAKTQI